LSLTTKILKDHPLVPRNGGLKIEVVFHDLIRGIELNYESIRM